MTLRVDARWLRRALLVASLAGGAVAAATVLGAFHDSATAVDLPPVARQMSAFTKQPPLSASAVPASVKQFEDMVTGRAGYGAARSDQVRLLARGLGRHGVNVYGFPTAGGAVCYVVEEATYVASCAPRFHADDGNVVYGTYSGLGTPQTVMGVAPDGVKAVAVVVKGAPVSATLRNNVFFWQAPDGVQATDITALRIRQANGTSITVGL
jgi:hypothetical protein